MNPTAPEHTDAMYRLALQVRSRRDLERFLGRLAEDYESNRQVWENRSIPDYLVALADCSRRSEDAAQSGGPASAAPELWEYLARLLLGASVLRRAD